MRGSLTVLTIAAMIAAYAAAPGIGAEPGGVAFLEGRVRSDPDDFVAWNQLGERYLALLRERGEDRYIDLATKAAAASLRSVPIAANPGGLALKAKAALAAHLFSEARSTAESLNKLTPGRPGPRLILGDALLELGEVAEAAKIFDELGREEVGAVDMESRFARVALVEGRLEDARDHLQSGLKAAKALGLPAPELVSWYSVQIGELAFRQGDWTTAEKCYEEALKLSPDHLSARDHLGELRAAQKKYDEAASIYEDVVNRSPRPPLMQALGDLYSEAGNKALAEEWYDKAQAAYLASIERGEVQYLHHLAGFFSDSRKDPAQAVKWARKDLEGRHSIQAWDALAWALFRNGQFDEAAEAIRKAMATGAADAHILQHAGMIFMSAGDLARGRAELERAAEVNPQFEAFHVHR